MTATRAVFLFDMIHPFALTTQRVAGFALGVSTCSLLGCVRREGVTALARYGRLAAGAIAMALAVAFPETTKADQAAFVLRCCGRCDGQCHAPAAWNARLKPRLGIYR